MAHERTSKVAVTPTIRRARPFRVLRPQPLRSRIFFELAAAAGLGLVAVASGFAAARAPLLSLAGLLAALLVRLAFGRFSVAIGILVASLFFGGSLTHSVIALLVAVLWGLEWLLRGRRVVWSPALVVLAGFLLWGLVSSAAHDTSQVGEFARRYVSFLGLYFLTLQAVDGSTRRARTLVNVAVFAAAVSAFISLIPFLAGDTTRASGPLSDANDFGVLLASVVPLAIVRFEWAASRFGRAVAATALVLLTSTTLATFSRSALVGLAASGAWAWATGRLRLRAAFLVMAAVALAALAVYQYAPQRVQTALEQKASIADANVQDRFLSWKIALREFSTSPVLGVGAGNYETRSLDFAPPARLSTGTDNTYLNVLAELGVPGVALFVGFCVVSWARLRRRLGDPAGDHLQSAVAAGFLVVVAGALFLNLQFSPELWFLSALGATLPPGSARRGRALSLSSLGGRSLPPVAASSHL